MKNLSQKQKGIVALIVLASIWGAMGIFSRYLNTGFTIFQQVYLRLIAAGVAGYLFFKKDISLSKFSKISTKDWLILLVRAILYYSIGVSLYSLSVINTKLSNAVFIDSLPATAILGFILLKERASWKKVLYVILAFVGVLVIGSKGLGFNNLFNWGKGEFFMFISVWCTSLSMVIRKWQSKYLNNKEMTLLILFIGAIGAFLFSLVGKEGLPTSHWTTGLLFVVVLAGIANTAITYLINYGFERVNAVLGSNLLTLQSLVAIIVGFLVYKEIPMFKDLLGGVIITLGVIGMNKLESKS